VADEILREDRLSLTVIGPYKDQDAFGELLTFR